MANLTQLRAMMPPLEDWNRPFWEGTRQYEFRLQYGQDGIARFPGRPSDTLDPGSPLEWRAASGRGRLWSWTVMHQNYLPAYADEIPYPVGLIQLDEGPLVVSLLRGDVAALECDTPMKVVFEKVDDEWVLPRFERA